ncbi:hypothetical protein [Legionella sp. 29fVS95]
MFVLFLAAVFLFGGKLQVDFTSGLAAARMAKQMLNHSISRMTA